MDTNLFKLFFKNKILTDVNLIFKDNVNQKSIECHKIILAIKSKYFEKLFTLLKEKNQIDIIICVDNCYIAYDIILNMYGIDSNINNMPQWKHIYIK